MGTENLAGAVRAFLKQRGEAASSLLIADRFLRAKIPDELLATRVLETLLRPAGLAYEPDRGWTFALAAPGSETDEESETPRQVACAVSLTPPRIEGVCLVPVSPRSEEAVRPLAFRAETEGDLDWIAISAMLDRTEAVFVKPDVESPRLLMGLAARGLPAPARVRSLSTAVRGAVRLPRGSGVEAICQILGTPYREGDSVLDAAGNVAACLEAAAEKRRSADRERSARSGAEDWRSGSRAPAEARADAEAPKRGALAVLTPAWLADVPSLPGVYRFYGAAGLLLYVGKAANLRRRLSSHARSAADASAPSRALESLDRLHQVEYEVTGSELEALLREAKLIATRSPRSNVQREVHERGREYAPGRSQALLFPAGDSGSLSVVFVRAGRCEGVVRIGPRGGGIGRASRILRRLFGPSPRRSSPGTDADSEILRSWLSRYSDSVSRVDLDTCRGPADALALLLRLRREWAGTGAEPTHHRRP